MLVVMLLVALETAANWVGGWVLVWAPVRERGICLSRGEQASKVDDEGGLLYMSYSSIISSFF